MKNNLLVLACLMLYFSLAVQAQNSNSSLENNLKQHIYILAADSMEGRRTGSEGEKKAQQYLLGQYKKMGFTTKTLTAYTQDFTFNYGYEYAGDNLLIINGNTFLPDKDFFPLPGSGNGNVSVKSAAYVKYGIEAPELEYNDYKDVKDSMVYIISLGTPEGENPHSKYYVYSDVSVKIKTALKHGAKAIILVNAEPDKCDDIKKDFTKNSSDKKIPIVFLNHSATMNIPFATGAMYRIQVQTSIKPVIRNGTNVIAFIDNKSKNTVVIGAHYDHLGHGEDGNSLSGGSQDIHNGADDNASGTAALLELARLLKSSKSKKNNYLFIHFSGEELGLIGSKYFVDHATIDTSTVNYMINMDMIGRYQKDKGLEISGVGTSPTSFQFIRTMKFDSLKIKIGEHGVGPTDHTSFYYANIPVLNFFTGTHEDYHKPSDDAEKINYGAQASIVKMIASIIDSLNNKGVLAFTKTKEVNTNDVPAFKVKLGVIPDYMYEGNGLRIDGVNEGQPAAIAGLQKGDIITQIGDYPVTDIMSYMKTLSMFTKGSKTTIKYIRNGNEIISDLQF